MGQLLVDWFTATTPPVIFTLLALFIPYQLIKQMGLAPTIMRVTNEVWRRVKPYLYW